MSRNHTEIQFSSRDNSVEIKAGDLSSVEVTQSKRGFPFPEQIMISAWSEKHEAQLVIHLEGPDILDKLESAIRTARARQLMMVAA